MFKTDLKVIEIIKRKIDSLIKGLKVDYSVVSVEEIYNSIWLVLLKEGYSIRKNKFLYEIYNVKPLVMYKYNLKSLTNVQKVQFSRGLNRTLKDMNGVKLSRVIVLIPISFSERFEEFLKIWNIKYETRKYELMSELIKDI